MPASRSSNRRIFPRYRIERDFVLEAAGEKLNARLKDLSITGLGLVIDGYLKDLRGDSLDIRIAEIGLETAARIVWTEKKTSGLRLGLLRTGPIRGDIRSVRLADVFLGLRKIKRTGILHITTAFSVKEVYFKSGEVVFVTADAEENEVNDILLYSGKITIEQFDSAAERTKTTGRSQEAELVAMGHIRPEDLLWAIRRQAEKIFLGLLELEEGSFVFLECTLPADRFLSPPLDPVELIFHAARALREDRRTGTLPDMDLVVYVPAEEGIIQKGVTFSDSEKKVMLLVNGERTVREIALLSPVGEFETLRTIFALASAQMVNLGGPQDDMLRPYGKKEPTDTQDGPGIEIMAKIDRLYRDHKKLGYYGVLDIARNAPLEEIKLAYYRMAKEFHPDRYLRTGSDSLREKLNVLFSYINEAYRSLTVLNREQQPKLKPVSESDEDRNRKMARQRFDEGKAYLDRKNFEQAQISLGQAAYLDGLMPDYQYYYACSLVQNKKLKDAEVALRKALHLDPYNAEYSAELGHIYLQLGFHTRARSALEKALRYDPSNRRAAEGLKKCMQ